MKVMYSSCEILPQENGVEGIYKIIEKAGRTCYHSEKNITNDSAEKFAERMAKSGHTSMLEHGSVYLEIRDTDYREDHFGIKAAIDRLSNDPYTKVQCWLDPYQIYEYNISTNLRVLFQNNCLHLLKFVYSPSKLNINVPSVYHERRVTFLMHVDRITGESFLRHRTIMSDELPLECIPVHIDDHAFSYARESTRYCNYSKGNFGGDIAFIVPGIIRGLPEIPKVADDSAVSEWAQACSESENHYMSLLKKGWTPEYARYVLDFSIYSPLVMTGFVSDWDKFFALRCSDSKVGRPHPDASFIADMARQQLREFLANNR